MPSSQEVAEAAELLRLAIAEPAEASSACRTAGRGLGRSVAAVGGPPCTGHRAARPGSDRRGPARAPARPASWRDAAATRTASPTCGPRSATALAFDGRTRSRTQRARPVRGRGRAAHRSGPGASCAAATCCRWCWVGTARPWPTCAARCGGAGPGRPDLGGAHSGHRCPWSTSTSVTSRRAERALEEAAADLRGRGPGTRGRAGRARPGLRGLLPWRPARGAEAATTAADAVLRAAGERSRSSSGQDRCKALLAAGLPGRGVCGRCRAARPRDGIQPVNRAELELLPGLR